MEKKNTAALADGYVTGLEPGTNYPNHRSIEREKGRVPKLQGGQTYHAGISITALTTPEEVRKASDRIAKLQGSTKAQVETESE